MPQLARWWDSSPFADMTHYEGWAHEDHDGRCDCMGDDDALLERVQFDVGGTAPVRLRSPRRYAIGGRVSGGGS